jgi:hypothetical protein
MAKFRHKEKGWRRDDKGRWYDENGFQNWREALHFIQVLLKLWREANPSFGWGPTHAGNSGLCQHCPHYYGDHVTDWKTDPPTVGICLPGKCDCATYESTPYRYFGISSDVWDQAPVWIFNFRLFSGTVYFW